MGTFWNSNKTALLKDLTRLCPNGEAVHFSNWYWVGMERKTDKELTITRSGKRIILKVEGWEGDIAPFINTVKRYEGYNHDMGYTQQWNFSISGWNCPCPISNLTIYEKDPVEPEWRKRMREVTGGMFI